MITLKLTESELRLIENALLKMKIEIGEWALKSLDVEWEDNVMCQEIAKLEMSILKQVTSK